MYGAHLGTDTLTNLGLMSWKFVPDKIKTIQRYQSSNLGLKLEPLRTAHVGSAKRFLRILISLKLLKSLMESVDLPLMCENTANHSLNVSRRFFQWKFFE